MRVDTKLITVIFFRGGWRGVIKWCIVRAHERTISASTFDFRPTLKYESTSADLRQHRLTSFCAVCGCIIWLQKGKHCGICRVEGYNARHNKTKQKQKSQSAECLQPNLVLWCTTMSRNVVWKRKRKKKKKKTQKTPQKGFYLQGQGHNVGL